MVDSARQVRSATYPVWVFFAVPLGALLIQVYLPLFETLRFVSRIELPLLVTIYFALMRRSQLRGLAIGVTLGLAQDSRFPAAHRDVRHLQDAGRLFLGFHRHAVRCGARLRPPGAVFFLLPVSPVFLLGAAATLLDQPAVFDIQTELISAALNAVIGVRSVSLPRQAAQARVALYRRRSCRRLSYTAKTSRRLSAKVLSLFSRMLWSGRTLVVKPHCYRAIGESSAGVSCGVFLKKFSDARRR